MRKNPLAYARVIDKLKIPEEHDRRRKLTIAQHNEIKRRYKAGGCSRYDLMKEYGVAYGTIQRLTSESARKQILKAGKKWRKNNPRIKYDSMELRRRKKWLIERGMMKSGLNT